MRIRDPNHEARSALRLPPAQPIEDDAVQLDLDRSPPRPLGPGDRKRKRPPTEHHAEQDAPDHFLNRECDLLALARARIGDHGGPSPRGGTSRLPSSARASAGPERAPRCTSASPIRTERARAAREQRTAALEIDPHALRPTLELEPSRRREQPQELEDLAGAEVGQIAFERRRHSRRVPAHVADDAAAGLGLAGQRAAGCTGRAPASKDGRARRQHAERDSVSGAGGRAERARRSSSEQHQQRDQRRVDDAGEPSEQRGGSLTGPTKTVEPAPAEE